MLKRATILQLVLCVLCSLPAPAHAQHLRHRLLGAWVDHVHGEAEWFWEFRADGTFIGDHLQGREHMEGKYRLDEDLLFFKWRTPAGEWEQAWGRLLSADGDQVRFRFSPVKHRLAQAPEVHLVRPGEQAESYTERQLESKPQETQPLVRVFTESGRRLVGTIIESKRNYIVLQSKRGTHKIRRLNIMRIEPATAKHAQ